MLPGCYPYVTVAFFPNLFLSQGFWLTVTRVTWVTSQSGGPENRYPGSNHAGGSVVALGPQGPMFSPNFPQAQAEVCRSGQAEIALRPDAASSERFDASVDVTSAPNTAAQTQLGASDRSAQ